MGLSLHASTVSLRLIALCVCALQLAFSQQTPVHKFPKPSGQRAITLEPLTDDELVAQSLIKDEKVQPNAPANFREFGAAQANQVAEPKRITLRFTTAATLTKIESTPDFRLEQGGTCLEGNTYAANAICTLMVRFTPQGPGRRIGKLAISSAADATPFYVGIGGYGSAPALSFNPSIITTVPGTYVNGAGLLSGAHNLATDGGDALYIADTGNKLVRYLGSNNTLQSIYFELPLTDPQGVAVDAFESTFLTEDNPARLAISIGAGGGQTEYNSGSTNCSIGATCNLSGAPLGVPGALAADPSGNIFFADLNGNTHEVYQILASSDYGALSYVPLLDPQDLNSDNYNEPGPIAVDANDTIYALQNYDRYCFLSLTSHYYASIANYDHSAYVAGGRECGFSGDGGQARSALIGTSVGQMAFDIAGNLYFTDTSNNRVRRIDAATGIITTIAGNGIAGYVGDGGPSTNAELNAPTGLAVDSQGQVYIISSSAATGPAQVVRKVGITGSLTLLPTIVGNPSAPQSVTIANTGNATLNFAHVGFTSGATTDFAIDPNTTNCIFTMPLASGQSCKVGIIFTPTTTGNRIAQLTIEDNTVTGSNTIQVNGGGYTTATLTPASLTFASTTVGSSTASQAATLRNTGKAAMSIVSIALSGTGAASYSKTTTCTATLAIGASCTIAVTFKPTSTGAQPATLTILDNAFTLRQTVVLTGTGVAAKAAITPASSTLGPQMVSSASDPTLLTLTNSSATAITISSYSFSGANAADFTQTHTCGTSLAPSASCSIAVVFKPAALGTCSGTLNVATTAGTMTASMTGTSVPPTTATLTPTALTFPTTDIGSNSPSQFLTLANSGAATLYLSSINLSGPDARSYSRTTTCGATLAAGANCTIAVTFSPIVGGFNRVTLDVTDNTPILHQDVSLSGIGNAPGTSATLTPAVLSFPDTDVGLTAPAQTATLTNTGTTVLHISSIVLSGADAQSYSETTTCGATLAVKASCTLVVTFVPILGGSNRVTLSVTDSTVDYHQNVALTGMGLDVGSGPISLTPASLYFPNVNYGSSSPPQNLTLTNTGKSPLTIASINVVGQYTYAQSYPFTTTCQAALLAAGSSCTIAVTFKPSTSGLINAVLTVADSTGAAHQNASLTGLGLPSAAGALSISPASLNFGTVDLNSLASQTLNIKNTGKVALSLSGAGVVGPMFNSYLESSNCFGTPLQVGETCTISVTFAPQVAGPSNVQLLLQDITGAIATYIPIYAIAGPPPILATLTPASHNFGNVAEGTSSAPLQLTYTNVGTEALSLNGYTFSGDRLAYSDTNNCGETLAIGASCIVNVFFTPDQLGASTSTLTAYQTTSGGTTVLSETVSLSGTGTAPIRAPTLTPGTLNFGNVALGANTGPQQITLTNTAPVPLQVTNILLNGLDQSAFMQTNNCTTVIAVGASCEINVTFTPNQLYTVTAALTVSETLQMGKGQISQTVALIATGIPAGPSAAFIPNYLNFGSVAQGATGGPQRLTLSNTGTQTLTVLNFLFGDSGVPYSQTNNCGTTLAIGTQCTFNISFTPHQPSPTSTTFNATLVSQSGDVFSVTASLAGTGIAATTAATLTPPAWTE